MLAEAEAREAAVLGAEAARGEPCPGRPQPSLLISAPRPVVRQTPWALASAPDALPSPLECPSLSGTYWRPRSFSSGLE